MRADRSTYLDDRWGPHSIDRFATIDNRQPLAAPHTGRFCSQYFHPEAEWTDALSVSWAGENNWVYPPFHLVGAAVAQLRASGAVGTLVCPSAPWAPWWHLLRSGTGWAADVVDMVPLGAAEAALTGSSGYHELSCRNGIIAVRLGRRSRTEILRVSPWRRPVAGRPFVRASPRVGPAHHGGSRSWTLRPSA